MSTSGQPSRCAPARRREREAARDEVRVQRLSASSGSTARSRGKVASACSTPVLRAAGSPRSVDAGSGPARDAAQPRRARPPAFPGRGSHRPHEADERRRPLLPRKRGQRSASRPLAVARDDGGDLDQGAASRQARAGTAARSRPAQASVARSQVRRRASASPPRRATACRRVGGSASAPPQGPRHRFPARGAPCAAHPRPAPPAPRPWRSPACGARPPP
jgi:hypothetical protein